MRLLHGNGIIEGLLHLLLNDSQHAKDGGFELRKLIPANTWIR